MNFSKVKEFMDHLTQWRIPGNDISVWLDNEEVFRYQSGYLDVENKVKMTDNNLIYIYSCSKIATVVAGLQLLERGKFLLDTPLYDFIPEFKEMYIKDEKGERRAQKDITLRHLFTMTAGMTYDFPEELLKEAGKRTNNKFNTVEVVKTMAKMPLSFEPGENWQYSLCHDVLAAIIEVISGKRFRDYMKENIFDPLGMNETYYHLNPDTEKRIAPQYSFVNFDEDVKDKPAGYTQAVDMTRCGGYIEREEGNFLVYGEEYDSGGAGIISSVPDYVKFINALANNGMGKTGERILSSHSVNLLKQNQLSEKHIENYNWPQLIGYGYGLGVKTMINPAAAGSLSSVGEFGWGGAAGASAFIDTDLKLGVFYSHHMLNTQEPYYQPRLRNVIYSCIDK